MSLFIDNLDANYQRLNKKITSLEDKLKNNKEFLVEKQVFNPSTPLDLPQISDLKARLKTLHAQSENSEQIKSIREKAVSLLTKLKELEAKFLQEKFPEACPPSSSIPLSDIPSPRDIPIPSTCLNFLTLNNLAHLVGDAILEKARTTDGQLIEGKSQGIEFMHAWLKYLKQAYGSDELWPKEIEDFSQHLEELEWFSKQIQESLNFLAQTESREKETTENQFNKSVEYKKRCENIAKQIIQKLEAQGSVRFSWGWHASKPDRTGHAMLIEIKLNQGKGHYSLHVFNTGDGTEYHQSQSDGTKLYVNTLQSYLIPAKNLDENFIFKMLEPLLVPFSHTIMNLNAEFEASNLYLLLSRFPKLEQNPSNWMKGQLSGTCRLRALIAYLAFYTKSYKIITNLWEREIARCLISLQPKKLEERDMRVLTSYLLARLFHQQAKILKFNPTDRQATKVLNQLNAFNTTFETICRNNKWEIPIVRKAGMITNRINHSSVTAKIREELKKYQLAIPRQKFEVLPPSNQQVSYPLPLLSLKPTPAAIIEYCHAAHQLAKNYTQQKGDPTPFLINVLCELSSLILNNSDLEKDLQPSDCTSLLEETLELSVLLFDETNKHKTASNLKIFLALHSALAIGWQLLMTAQDKGDISLEGIRFYRLALPPCFTLSEKEAIAQLPSPCLDQQVLEVLKTLNEYFRRINKITKKGKEIPHTLFEFSEFYTTEQPLQGHELETTYSGLEENLEMLILSEGEYKFTKQCLSNVKDWKKVDEQKPSSVSEEEWRIYCYYTGHCMGQGEGFPSSFVHLRRLALLAKAHIIAYQMHGKNETHSFISFFADHKDLGPPRIRTKDKNKLCFSIGLKGLTKAYSYQLPTDRSIGSPLSTLEARKNLSQLGDQKNLSQNELLIQTDSPLHELVSAQASKSSPRFTTLISYFNKHLDAVMDEEKQAYFMQLFFEADLFDKVIDPELTDLIIKSFDNYLNHFERLFKVQPYNQKTGNTLAFVCEQYERILCKCILALEQEDKKRSLEKLEKLQHIITDWNKAKPFLQALTFREHILLCLMDSFNARELTSENKEEVERLIMTKAQLERVRIEKQRILPSLSLSIPTLEALKDFKESAQRAFLKHLSAIQTFLISSSAEILTQISSLYMPETDIKWHQQTFPIFEGQDLIGNRYTLDVKTGEFKKNGFSLFSYPSSYEKHPLYQDECNKNSFTIQNVHASYYEGFCGEVKIRLYGDAQQLVRLDRYFEEQGWYSLLSAEQRQSFLPSALQTQTHLQAWIKAEDSTESPALIIFNKLTHQAQYAINQEGSFIIRGKLYECLEIDAKMKESLQDFDSQVILWKDLSNQQYLLSFPYLTSPSSKNQTLQFELHENHWIWKEDPQFFIAENQQIGGLEGFKGFLIIQNQKGQYKALIPQKTQYEFEVKEETPRQVSCLVCRLTSPPKNSPLVSSDWTPELTIQSSSEVNGYLAYLHFMHAHTHSEYRKTLSFLQHTYSFKRFNPNELRTLGWIFCHAQKSASAKHIPKRGINHIHEAIALQLYIAALIRQNLEAHPSNSLHNTCQTVLRSLDKQLIPQDLDSPLNWEKFWEILSLASWSTDQKETDPIPLLLQEIIKAYLARRDKVQKALQIESLVPPFLLDQWGLSKLSKSKLIEDKLLVATLKDLDKVGQDLEKLDWKEVLKDINSHSLQAFPPFNSRQGKSFRSYFKFLFEQALDKNPKIKEFLDEAQYDTFSGNRALRAILRIACEIEEHHPLFSIDAFPAQAKKVVELMQTLLSKGIMEIEGNLLYELNSSIKACVKLLPTRTTKEPQEESKRTFSLPPANRRPGRRNDNKLSSRSSHRQVSSQTLSNFSSSSQPSFSFSPTLPFTFNAPSTTFDNPLSFNASPTQPSFSFNSSTPAFNFNVPAMSSERNDTPVSSPTTLARPPRQILLAANKLELPSAYPSGRMKVDHLKANLFQTINQYYAKLFSSLLSSRDSSPLYKLAMEMQEVKDELKKSLRGLDEGAVSEKRSEIKSHLEDFIPLVDQFKLHTLLDKLHALDLPQKPYLLKSIKAIKENINTYIKKLNEYAQSAGIHAFGMPENVSSPTDRIAHFIASSVKDLALDYYLGAIKNYKQHQIHIKINDWKKVEKEFTDISQQLMEENKIAMSQKCQLEEKILMLANQQLDKDIYQAAKVGAKHKSNLTLDNCILLFLEGDTERYRKKMGFARLEGKQQGEELHALIGKYLEAFVFSHHLQNICKTIEQVNTLTIEKELSLAIGKLGELMATSHDLSDCPVPHIFLVFEYFMTKHKDGQLFLVRQHSIKGLSHALQIQPDHRWRDIFIQLIQAGGKTLVWGQLLALAKADGYHLSVHVSPDHQYTTSLYNMGENALALFNQEQRTFEFDERPENLAEQYLIHLKERLILAINKRQFIHTTSESLQALRCRFLKEILQLKNNESPQSKEIKSDDSLRLKKITLMGEILSLFRSRGVFTFDEVHQAMDPLKELNMPFGKTVHPDVQQGELIGKLLRLLISVIKDEKSSLKDIIDQLNQQTHHKGLISKMMEKLPDLFLEDAGWREKLGVRQKSEKEELIQFINDPQKPLPEFLQESEKSLEEGLPAADYAILAQRLIGDRWLIEGLQKKVDEHHGIVAVKGHPSISIPFQANMKPLIGSEFSDHYVMMIHTLIAYLSKGIMEEQVEDFIDYLRIQAVSEMQAVRAPDLQKTTAYQAFTILKEKEPMLTNFFEHQKVDKRSFCHALSKSSDDIVLQLLVSYISLRVLNKVKLYESQVSSNGKSTATMAKTINGYSGNLDNPDMRPTLDSEGRRVEWYPDSGTSGQTIDLLINRHSTLHITKSDPSALLNLLHHQDYKDRMHAIIDVGCHFRGLSSLEVAQLISSQVNKDLIKGILFYDPQGHLFCLHTHDQNWQPIQGTDKEHLLEQTGYQLNQLFTYYDQEHITGADIPQHDHALAIVTASEATPLYQLCQGNRRMRKLEGGQGVVHALSESCLKCMKDKFVNDSLLLNLSEGGAKDPAIMQRFIFFTHLNEMEIQIKNNLQYCLQDVVNTAQQYVLDWLYEKNDEDCYKRLASQGSPLFARQVITNLLQEYGKGKETIKIEEYLEKVCWRLIETVKKLEIEEDVGLLETRLKQICFEAIPRLKQTIELSANFLTTSTFNSHNREATMVQCQESQMAQENESEQLAINQTRMLQASKSPDLERQALKKKVFFSPNFGRIDDISFTLRSASEFFIHEGLKAIENFECLTVSQNYLRTILNEDFSLTSRKPITHLLLIEDKAKDSPPPSFKVVIGSQEDVNQFESYIKIDKTRQALGRSSKIPEGRQMALLLLPGHIVEGPPSINSFVQEEPLQNLLAVVMLLAGDIEYFNQEKWLNLLLSQLKKVNRGVSQSLKNFFENQLLPSYKKEHYNNSLLNRRWSEML
ncbi:hypothetical protein [Neochlamydia sp. AcF95]|uniref:hypothetical protein n=1 Tax=Neochlamydia sp. AcF95 TaxID=2795734 RepID=UPI001BC963AE|nr:hypothetical protein [Neochlamydia sp. AcF95]MBS4170294.1 hypothetical protein [Neochlamydia sp. AcF95]